MDQNGNFATIKRPQNQPKKPKRSEVVRRNANHQTSQEVLDFQQVHTDGETKFSQLQAI